MFAAAALISTAHMAQAMPVGVSMPNVRAPELAAVSYHQ
jgi:hypothetical protein